MQPMKPMKPMEPMTFSEPARWWPEGLGSPDSSGSQNDVHYAYFGAAHRLLLRQDNEVITYDTGQYQIQGISQASDRSHASFTSTDGVVDVSKLERL